MEDYDYLRTELTFILDSKTDADRLLNLVTATAKRSTASWWDMAVAAKAELLKGKTLEQVIGMLANYV